MRKPRVRSSELVVRRVGTFYWFGRALPIVVGIDLTPELSRQYADPATHPSLVDRVALAIAEQYVYDTDEELPIESVRARVEDGVRRRFGRPGLVQVNLTGLRGSKLAPHVDVPVSIPPNFVPPSPGGEPGDLG